MEIERGLFRGFRPEYHLSNASLLPDGYSRSRSKRPQALRRLGGTFSLAPAPQLAASFWQWMQPLPSMLMRAEKDATLAPPHQVASSLQLLASAVLTADGMTDETRRAHSLVSGSTSPPPPTTMPRKSAIPGQRSVKLERRFLVFCAELVAEVSSCRRAPRFYATIHRWERLLTMPAVGRRAGIEWWIGCQADGCHDPPQDSLTDPYANHKRALCVALFEKS
jgi:hypothetical protein